MIAVIARLPGVTNVFGDRAGLQGVQFGQIIGLALCAQFLPSLGKEGFNEGALQAFKDGAAGR